MRIENTVRDNDLAAHSALALALTSLGTAVSHGRRGEGLGRGRRTAPGGDAYLAKFPADGSAPSAGPSPSGSPSPSSTAVPSPS